MLKFGYVQQAMLHNCMYIYVIQIRNNSLDREKPSCLHTTPASWVDHPSSTMVPHVSSKQTSTRPAVTPAMLPFAATSLTSPSLQRPGWTYLLIHVQ